MFVTGVTLDADTLKPLPDVTIKYATVTLAKSSSDGTFEFYVDHIKGITFSKDEYFSKTLLVWPGDTLRITLYSWCKCYSKLLFNFVILSHSH